MIKPILLYGAEIWGHKKIHVIESVQVKFCKFLLHLGSQTVNTAVIGECGRYPLYVTSVSICIKYWVKLIHMDYSRMAKHAYIMLYNLDCANKRNWATDVKQILFSYGFGYVWTAQSIGNVRIF